MSLNTPAGGQAAEAPDCARKATQIVTFDPGDPENPRNWPRWRKWAIVGIMIPVDLSVSFGASGFSPGISSFAADMGVSHEVATLGLSLYIIGLALGPMSLAPLSEYFGRRPVYVLSYGTFLLVLLGTALVHNLAGFLILRTLSGTFAAVTIANFGGTIADLYDPHHTGPAMSLFLWAATAGSPLGFFLMSVVAQNHGWRDIFWALFGICGGLWVLMMATMLVCGETRHSIILFKRIKREEQRTGTSNLDLPEELRQRGPRELFSVALTRPFRFLATEAIIIFGALYNGYLYGLSFLFNGAFSLVFGAGNGGRGFDTLQVGCCFLGIVLGISVGPLTNTLQERIYQRRVRAAGGKDVPEARVQLAGLAAIVHPLSLLCFAATTDPRISAAAPIAASALWGWSFYTLILMTYSYTEDAYKHFSASALAGISLVRNIAGGVFPLFGEQMFRGLGFQWAAGVLALAALLLVPIPFVLARYGVELRRRSPWAQGHMDEVVDEDETSPLLNGERE